MSPREGVRGANSTQHLQGFQGPKHAKQLEPAKKMVHARKNQEDPKSHSRTIDSATPQSSQLIIPEIPRVSKAFKARYLFV